MLGLNLGRTLSSKSWTRDMEFRLKFTTKYLRRFLRRKRRARGQASAYLLLRRLFATTADASTCIAKWAEARRSRSISLRSPEMQAKVLPAKKKCLSVRAN